MKSSRTRPSAHFRTLTALAFLSASALTTLGCGSSPPSDAAAPAAEPDAAGHGVLLMAHGGSPEWNAAVTETVEPLRERYDIEIAFGMADAVSLQEALRKLESRGARKIGVVRLFVSGESFLDATEQIFGLQPGAPDPADAADAVHPVMAEYMKMYADKAHAGHGHGDAGHGHHAGHGAGHDAHAGHGHHGDGHHADHAAHGDGHGGHGMAFFRAESRSSFALSEHGLLDAPGMGVVLAERAAALSKDPAKEDVLIVAHGPGDDAENARWLKKLGERAEPVRAGAPFRRVQVETLREDWPDKRAEAEQRLRAFVERATTEGGTAIVIPFRVQGFGPYARVFEGLTYVSDGRGLIPHAEVTKWIENEINQLEGGPFREPEAVSAH